MAWSTRGRRGEVLETLVDMTNEHYARHKIARVDKAATPITVVEIDGDGFITKAFFEKKSTVDYFGIVQGIHISFDAKETNQRIFPLKNLHEHQVEYMRDIDEQGGLAFIIAHFKLQDIYTLIPFEIVGKFFYESKSGGRKSIPFEAIPEEFHIPYKNTAILPYLDTLNAYIDYKNKLKQGG